MNKDDKTLDEDFSNDEFDFDAIYKTIEDIEKSKQDKLNAMTTEQRAKFETDKKKDEQIENITEEIKQRRIQREVDFSKMSPAEALESYQKINKNAENFADEIGMESVDAETLKFKKNK